MSPRSSRSFRYLSGSLARLACAPVLALILASGPASAQSIPDGAGTAEFQYLDILVSARPAGLAGANTAAANGLDAVGYNPAGLSRLEPERALAATLRYHMLGIASGNVTYAFPAFRGSDMAFSASYVNYGRIEELDEEGNTSGHSLMPTSFNPSLTWSRSMAPAWRMGATGRLLTEYLGDFAGSDLAWGWGVDLGLQYQPGAKNAGFGLALVNLGRKEAAHYLNGSEGGLLPASLKAGLFYQPTDLPKARLVTDLEMPWSDSPVLSGGLEYAYNANLTLRGGSRLTWAEGRHYLDLVMDDAKGSGVGNALKAAAGMTFQVDGLAVDYAVQYWYGLSFVHAATLRYTLI